MTGSVVFSNHCSRQALLLVAHKLSYKLLEKYRRLKSAFAPYGDVFLVYQADTPPYEAMSLCGIDAVAFSIEDLAHLPYMAIEPTIIPGSNHFILLWFFKKYPKYSHYWNIEYDVEYCGKWAEFFEAFSESDSDFLSSHIRNFNCEPQWYWWSAFFSGNIHVPLQERLASFNPIYRITAKALDVIHNRLSSGWAGHHEVFIPTVLSRYGYKLEDFGGNGKYVKPKNINKFYDNEIPAPFGTMRHKISFNMETIDKNRKLLYHPVKDVM